MRVQKTPHGAIQRKIIGKIHARFPAIKNQQHIVRPIIDPQRLDIDLVGPDRNIGG